MLILWGMLAGLMVWLELVYHLSGFGLSPYNPMFAILLITAWAGILAFFIGILRGRWKKLLFYAALWVPVLWAGAQLVYLHIFRQPLLWEAMIRGGEDALTNYWREMFQGIADVLPWIIALALPAAAIPVVAGKCGWELPAFSSLQAMRTLLVAFVGIAGSAVMLEVGKAAGYEYYEEYSEFYDPLTVAEDMGILPVLHGDTAARLRRFAAVAFSDTAAENSAYVPVMGQNVISGGSLVSSGVSDGDRDVSGGNAAEESEEESGTENETAPEPVIRPQEFQLDYELLHQLADNDHQTWLADYIQGQTPVNTNEYTGLFKGYNLIFLTAEAFCTYAVDPELTPTLYRLSHSGFVFHNYYVPLWQTSTSDGEYINMTGLIPDQQFSLRRSAQNAMPYCLPGFFAAEGVHSYAYHDNSLSYYDRHLSHPNLGYDFRASKLGELDEAEWGDHVFTMEDPEQWPASDYNMMVGTVPEYVHDERFHVYYMTVSGHMNYNFKGNAMSAKNREAVAGLELPETLQAYIACNIELDKALENLLEQLKEAGQLEKTVICLSADHYPYGLSDEEYAQLAGRDLSALKDKFRNTLILWNAGMEEEPVYVDKVCGSMDLLPTLLNLFGFEYDSRMYAGKDIFSDNEGMVIFNNRDFVTDSVVFIEKGDITTWLQDADGNDIVPDEEKEAYLEAARKEVKQRYNFSAYVLQENYYSDIMQAVIQE